MKKLIKSTLVLGLMLNLSALTAQAASDQNELEGNFRPPVESNVGDQLYIDGVPYYSSEDIKKFDKEQKEDTQTLNRENSLVQPMGTNKWTFVNSSNYYTGQDYDRFNNGSNQSVRMNLETESKMTGEVTGTVKYGFEAIAEAEMSLKIGQEYRKKVSIDVTIKPWHTAELKSAARGIKRNYEYTDTGWFGDTKYTASSYDNNGGVEYWLYDNPS
ncbi:hypothetical protein J2W97_004955 [Paenibacillus jamilae]|uniref:hypothetical protein n=1 Tax=Paenibacillus TaxID=44249 RepID=UPI000D320A27|nr:MULTISPECIES: hypothetical protein [Paenibacillus]MDP9678897.1 hypothetical protein [Paenibacillus jamilae]KAF6615177.1 hypothetical protein HFE00_21200 [Paenibacillus sp. EKM101P]KAF6618779.1 hypothetical protein HFE03_20590 [Paenibacillus sp. EKM102P]KAF6627200.1 hypothetical protein HFE01_20995 [Paenibacillus sp. EKM10P]KAF6643536.1 hypothetical protein HFE02_21345 [Paenibacillus sp. EKM11P]